MVAFKKGSLLRVIGVKEVTYYCSWSLEGQLTFVVAWLSTLSTSPGSLGWNGVTRGSEWARLEGGSEVQFLLSGVETDG